ncbi:MAG: 50S ribosomal protein L6 [Deltaproteobacteria bacterium]|nr:50S ribosomal protein L6 [Deltaproteobacteria bacterium]
MSRIGKKPIEIPAGVAVSRAQSEIKVKGPKGELSAKIPEGVEMVMGDGSVEIKRRSDDRKDRSVHGLTRTLVANMVRGVSTGFEKALEISGVGYRAELSGNVLKLVIGYSTPAEYVIPEGISVKIDRQVNLVVSGIDKQRVGMVAAEIRALKKPEPYKGKGIKYAKERIRRKVGKSVGA